MTLLFQRQVSRRQPHLQIRLNLESENAEQPELEVPLGGLLAACAYLPGRRPALTVAQGPPQEYADRLHPLRADAVLNPQPCQQNGPGVPI